MLIICLIVIVPYTFLKNFNTLLFIYFFKFIFQISDLHISIFHDQSRITEFQEFCDITIDAIKPAVVLASGNIFFGLFIYMYKQKPT